MYKTIIKIITVFFLTINIACAAGGDTTYRSLKDTIFFKKTLADYSEKLSTIESDFVQEKYMRILTTPVESDGYFCYKNGVMIRWEYVTPFSYIIVINNGRMSIRDENKTNSYDLTASQSFIKLNAFLGKILQGDVLTDKNDFSYAYFENDLYYKLVLKPKSKDIKVFFNEIVLYFEKKMFSVARVVMREVSGDKTDITFKNRKINTEIPDEKFILK